MTDPGDPGAYVENDPNSIGIVAAADGTSVAAVEGWDNALANARLIASAPDLLAALEQIGEGQYGCCNPIYPDAPVCSHNIARAAIAKATGTETT